MDIRKYFHNSLNLLCIICHLFSMWVIGQVKMFLLHNEKADLTVSKEIALNSDELLSFVLFAELKGPSSFR